MTNGLMIKVFAVVCPFGEDESCPEFLHDLSQRMSRIPVMMTRFLFCLFYWMPCLVVGRFRTVVTLSEEDQARYILWWEKNRLYFIREAFNAIKTVSLLARAGKDWEP